MAIKQWIKPEQTGVGQYAAVPFAQFGACPPGTSLACVPYQPLAYRFPIRSPLSRRRFRFLFGLEEDKPVKAPASGTLGQVNVSELTPGQQFYGAASLASTIAGAYHGYKRNDSVGWAIVWALLSGPFWPVAVPVMLAQGFGDPKRR